MIRQEEKRSIKKYLNIHICLDLVRIFVILTALFVDIEGETAIIFVTDILNGIGSLEDRYGIARVVALLVLVTTSVITVIYYIVSIASKKIYDVKDNVQSSSFVSFFMISSLLYWLRMAGWAIYLICTVSTYTNSVIDYLLNNLHISGYMVGVIFGFFVVAKISDHVNRDAINLINGALELKGKECDEETKAAKEEIKEELGIGDDDEPGMDEQIENLEILIKYKKMLDDGAITEAEFEQKKKQLMRE